MQTISYRNAHFAERLQPLFNRQAFTPETDQAAAAILKSVREDGDRALCAAALKFDKVELQPQEFRVTDAEIAAAATEVPADLRQAIRKACRQIRDFSRQGIPKAWSYSPRPGVILGERFVPFDRVGAYIPGGTAPLVSTVLHTVALAAAAGVPEIAVVTPARPDKSVHPAIIFAADCAGATEIYRLGGVYAIGALAYGTETVARVDKIVGPGNAYVTAAKRHVYGDVALDLVAGPSEIMIIADETADPRHIAADMLSQAEHGSGLEQAVLVTDHAPLLDEVENALNQLKTRLSRRETIERVLAAGVYLIEVETLADAAALAGRYAPEHLEIITRQPGHLAKKVKAAGAIFLGGWTPEPTGDFVAGPSHVLPTGGAGRCFSGLTVSQFFRRISIVNYQKQALRNELDMIKAFAEVEGLDAHGLSAAIRFE